MNPADMPMSPQMMARMVTSAPNYRETFEEPDYDGYEEPDHEEPDHEEPEYEDFTDTNKDLELWTCYPSNLENSRETFENSEKYSAGGDVSGGAVQGALAKSSASVANESEMNKLYMYLAIGVIILMIIYLLTSKNK